MTGDFSTAIRTMDESSTGFVDTVTFTDSVGDIYVLAVGHWKFQTNPPSPFYTIYSKG